jgi:hypothetical protein
VIFKLLPIQKFSSSFSHLQMTSAIRLGIHSQSGYGFYVKLIPMSSAKPLGLESNNQVEQAELILNQQRP